MAKKIWYLDSNPVSVLLAQKLCEILKIGFEEVKEEKIFEILSQCNLGKSILIMDLNSDPYHHLDSYPELHKRTEVYIISSSLRQSDGDTASSDPRVSGYLTLPLTINDLTRIASP